MAAAASASTIVARAQSQAPDIDSVVHVNPNGSPVHPGQLVNVKVIDYQAYDLVAEVPKKQSPAMPGGPGGGMGGMGGMDF